MQMKTLKDADAIHGGFGKPSKMPGYAYGIPAVYCKTGAALAKVPGSVCSKCYALKGRYVFPSVQTALERRFATLRHPRWVEAMTFSIRKRACEYFRWHDSGDLQGMWHLINIVEVANRCMDTKFWLPTRERGLILQYLRTIGDFPKNLVVRVSGTMIDGFAPVTLFRHTSTVSSLPKKVTCPAPSQDGRCGECRKCWSPAVRNISYLQH